MLKTMRTWGIRCCWFAAVLAAGLGCAPATVADMVIDIGGRTATVFEPPGYDPASPAPVLMLLHGWGGSGASQENAMGFGPAVEAEGFLFVHPDGIPDLLGRRFWNATPACCSFFGTPVDDSAYLRALIDEIKVHYNVDGDRVYVVGFSNGGFMAHRLACEHADTFAAAVSVAGATFDDPADCAPPVVIPMAPRPPGPIHVAEVHSTSDLVILYAGGSYFGNMYPGAETTVQSWVDINNCSAAADTSAPDLDLTTDQAGTETTVVRYQADCSENGSAELWTMSGVPHSPSYTANFSRDVIDYLLAHARAEADCPAWSCPSGMTSGWRLRLLVPVP